MVLCLDDTCSFIVWTFNLPLKPGILVLSVLRSFLELFPPVPFSFNKYFLRPPVTVVGTGDIAVNKTDKSLFPHGADILMSECFFTSFWTSWTSPLPFKIL